MRIRGASILALFFALVSASGRVLAATPSEAFIQSEHVKISSLLKQGATASRDAQISSVLDTMIDYDELTRRAFGQPCPTSAACSNHWTELTDPQKAEVRDLLRKLVAKNYRKNLIKTLDYDISYKGANQANADERVRTEAKSKTNVRDPVIQIDYVVRGGGSSFHVIDIYTERSSLTRNYYDQFHKMLTTPDQGYKYLVQKLTDKINKKD